MSVLYRAYDDRERLLYIGISDSPLIRLGQHAASSPWTVYVAKLTFERHATREAVEDAEREAIATEDPVWNMQGRPIRRFLQWMKAYPDGDPDEIDVDDLITRSQRRI